MKCQKNVWRTKRFFWKGKIRMQGVIWGECECRGGNLWDIVP